MAEVKRIDGTPLLHFLRLSYLFFFFVLPPLHHVPSIHILPAPLHSIHDLHQSHKLQFRYDVILLQPMDHDIVYLRAVSESDVGGQRSDIYNVSRQYYFQLVYAEHKKRQSQDR